MYAGGRGVPKDEVESFKWAILAADRGYQRAEQMLEVYPRLLTPGQVDKARKDAKAWADKYWQALDPAPRSASAKP